MRQDALHNVEGFVLERLSTKFDSAEDPSISIGDLMDSIDNTMFPLLRSSNRGFDCSKPYTISEDGENYQITQDGINELENRKREAIPL